MLDISAQILQGDAVSVLRSSIADASVDQVYLDPPFGTQLQWTGKAGQFSDRFEWNRTSRIAWAAMAARQPILATLLDACPLKPRDRAYLVRMVPLFAELHRVLHPAGSLWLHCDDTMGAYLRLALDDVFGPANALGAVFWKRTTSHNMSTRAFGRVHDSIYVYGRTHVASWRLWHTRHDFVHGDPCHGPVRVQGYSDIRLNPSSKERYPTQKPVALLEQFIAAGSLPGGLILDPTCGSGTTLVAARRLNRRAIGIDASADACRVARRRIEAIWQESRK